MPFITCVLFHCLGFIWSSSYNAARTGLPDPLKQLIMSQLGKRHRSGDSGFDNDAPPQRIPRLALDGGIPGTLSSPGSAMDLDLPDASQQIQNLMVVDSICYGALCEAQALMGSIPTNRISPWTRYCSFPVEIRDNGCFLSTEDEPKMKQRPVLDYRTGSILCFVAERIKDASFVAVVGVETLRPKRGKANRKSSPVEVTVNAYGPRSLMDEVGKAMMEVEVFLQHPVFLDSETAYINPHYFYPHSQETDLRHLIGPAYKESKSAVSQAIDDALDSANDCCDEVPLAGCDMDDLRNVLNSLLVDTELKDHQFQGIEFILGRENSDSVSATDKRLLSLIHYGLLSNRTEPGYGGILADVMGLGKTLTMLGAIVYSKHQQERLDAGDNSAAQLRARTLIVLPSRQVLDVWDNEIRRRFRPQTLQTTVFHGTKRVREGQLLLESDVVLTTYHTLENNSRSKAKVLHSIKWTRVVLDEAHQIRNPSTKFFKAAVSLESDIRWCLTGTPIQNSLDDLRSLLKFLRFEPFCQPRVFEDHIVKPLRKDPELGSNTARNLRVLLKASCLRRTQALLELPTVTTKEVLVTPTAEEKARFAQILEQCRAEFDLMAGQESYRKKPNVLFSAVMKLRQVCNHGVSVVNESNPRLFTSWRMTLDMLANMLSSSGIDFVQVDGRNPVLDRTALFSKFCEAAEVRVLLISINTGAVGLTLTRANVVHVVEPQWNPAIEEQAIARVVRMGQTRPVTVFKYIMTESVEQGVVKLQQRKIRIIKLSMQDRDESDADFALDTFKFALDPNEWN
ncbi:hypothetical protein CEP54_014883 [Fusarium duplospermum]|uniref:Uncharacterized protein n=1 Tax=Fusarium duplospermum TaxID=1325734 RepID=A0A428NT18_9HYPO|nr:hypothetical protein CEP54_014883 [Fusarium duplospermum]